MKTVLFFTFIISFLIITTTKVYAGTLAGIKDTITTSRPSASSPLASDQAAAASQVTIVDNGDIFLASDSATLRPDTGETLNTVTVASMSATNTPSASQRIIYFANTAANTHHAGDPIVVPVTAMHTIQFTTANAIPSSGKIVLSFPGTGSTAASPSATTFAFNGLTSANAAANISYKLDGSATCSFAVTAPNITCTASAGVAANTTITFLIGCADASTNETTCTTQSPRLINPAKTAAAGTADQWMIQAQTQDSNSVTIDSAKTKVVTNESVQVQAIVEPILTFTIAGVNNAITISTNNSNCTSNTDVTNAGINSSATFVDLGLLSSGNISIAAQDLTVSTNAQSGYTLTATTSGSFMDPSSGYVLASDSSLPGTFLTAGTEQVGIHACGTDVNTTNWGSATTGGGANARYAWPTSTSALTLASHSGPVDSMETTVEYAGTVTNTTPAGTYRGIITYVVTATF